MHPDTPHQPELTLDTRGRSCPLPVLVASRAADDLPQGALLQVISDCPGAHADLQAWARQTGREVIGVSEHADGGHAYLVRNGERWTANAVLDMRGRACPAPVVEAERALQVMGDGEVLKLLGDCSGFADEVGTWARTTGRQLLGIVPGPGHSAASYIRS